MPDPRLADEPGSWPVRSSEDLFRDDWVMALRADSVAGPGGRTHRRLVLEHPGAVVVLAVDETERVCLLRQYRHPGQGWYVELPAGLMDAAGEDPQTTAARELAEEAGLAAQTWEPLVTLRPSVGISTEVQRIFLATGITEIGRGDFEPHAEEAAMGVFRAPFDDLLDAVLDQRVATSPLVAAVLAYDARRRRGRGDPNHGRR